MKKLLGLFLILLPFIGTVCLLIYNQNIYGLLVFLCSLAVTIGIFLLVVVGVSLLTE